MTLSKKTIFEHIYYRSFLLKQQYNNPSHFIMSTALNQHGGGNKLKVTHNDAKYIFEYNKSDKTHVLFSSKSRNDYCVVVIIDTEYKSANINVINGFNKSCIIGSEHRVGTELLMITMKMLEKYKKKFNIKFITLSDHSTKSCKGKEIQMPLLSVLTSGDTWYGKYGFRPVKYDDDNMIIIDPTYNESYEYNKNKMNTLKLNKIDMKKYFIKLKNFSKEQFDNVEYLIDNYTSISLLNFLYVFLILFSIFM